MGKATVVAAVLGLALLVTNGWWAYRTLDMGVTYTYQQATLDEYSQGVTQALAVLNALAADPDSSREQLVHAAKLAWPAGEPFEKEGYVWVGRLGLAFGEDNGLRKVVMGAP